jgi:HK97 family phage major capsid protein
MFMKKTIEIDGKKYVLTEEKGVESAEETVEETAAEETTTETENTVSSEVLEKATQQVMKKLGLDKIHKSIEDLKSQVAGDSKETTKKKALINLGELLKKDVSELTAREKIIGFFQAVLQNDVVSLKALSEGTPADGGYLFPDEFRAEVIRDLEEQSRMRTEVTVIPMRRDVMNIPTLTSKPQVTWTEENAVKSTTTAHFGQVVLTAKKLAAIMYISDELIADSTDIDVVNFIIRLFSEAIGEEEDRVITRGNGTSEPTGFATATISSRSVAGSNLSFDDLINLEYDLPQKYHRNAKFYVHRNNIRELRKMKDSQGRYLWQDPVSASSPATFHGYPVIEDNNLSESEIYFGDLKMAYWLGDRQQMTVKISQDTETAFTKDQTAIRVVSRIAGNVVRAQALRKLTNIP